MSAPPRAKRWNPIFNDFFDEIFAKYPDAEAHDPCPCGLTLAVIPPCFVNPTLHFAVPDTDLRDRVRAFLEMHGRAESQRAEDDAVLVLTEIA